MATVTPAAVEFQSTPPARGATTASVSPSPAPPYFNPRPPRGGRRKHATAASTIAVISIHAPREGGDLNLDWLLNKVKISIHAPREGGDEVTPMVQTVGLISIHAPREGGDQCFVLKAVVVIISIHAPREGGDVGT